MNDTIQVSVQDRVATLTINRPEARNSLDPETLSNLIDSVYAAEGRDDVDVLILTSVGDVFSAGLDLKALSTGEIELGTSTGEGNPWLARTKPMIAAVGGPAITGGLEMVLNCDVAVASTAATFADTHARVGILPFWGLTALLPRAVGARNAALMSLTGNFIDAEQALAWGLVSEVVEPDRLQARARELAADMVNNDQPGMREILRLYRDGAGLSVEDGLKLEVDRALAWQGEGFDAAEIGRRFEAIRARGRSQTNRG